MSRSSELTHGIKLPLLILLAAVFLTRATIEVIATRLLSPIALTDPALGQITIFGLIPSIAFVLDLLFGATSGCAIACLYEQRVQNETALSAPGP